MGVSHHLLVQTAHEWHARLNQEMEGHSQDLLRTPPLTQDEAEGRGEEQGIQSVR